MLNGNAELLNFIYQNSQMGVITLNKLIDIVDDKQFKRYLKSQLKQYKRIHTKAKVLLNKNGYDEKGISAFEKLKTYLMMNIQTLKNSSTSHIAEMLIIGSNMGVIDAIKNLNKYNMAERKIIKIMATLLEIEEDNIQELKNFL